jgi:exonuclease-1
MKYVYLLLSSGIKPILVFDGQDLPAKRETNSKRREQRNLAKAIVLDLLKVGSFEEVRKQCNLAVDVTHQMAHELMVECRKINVDCLTAPYESDSQLCYLNQHGIADVVVTEDSELVVFGCTKVLFKLALDGSCLFFDAEKLHLTMNCSKEKFSFDKFQAMCVLSGCDYLKSITGIGLARAFQFFTKTVDTNMKRLLKKIPSYLNLKKVQVTEEYIEHFLKAIATFKYMYVFDPINRQMVRLNALDLDSEEIQYCGNAGILSDDKTALQLALGNIEPHNLLEVLDNYDPDQFSAVKVKSMRNFCNFPSIWISSGLKEGISNNLEDSLEDQSNLVKRQKPLKLNPRTRDPNQIPRNRERAVISRYPNRSMSKLTI